MCFTFCLPGCVFDNMNLGLSSLMGEDITSNLLKWNFYPGAHLGSAGKELKPGDSYFIDQYNQEYSRDIEPMTGGHTDNYYYQLIDNVRKYKGVEKSLVAGEKLRINIDGSFEQWNNVTSVYYDHIAHHNSLMKGKIMEEYYY